jgi:hypothetical protein
MLDQSDNQLQTTASQLKRNFWMIVMSMMTLTVVMMMEVEMNMS